MRMRTAFGISRAACITTALMILTLAAPVPAGAASLIANGSFESGFTGWTRADATGSDGTFMIQTGTTSPVNGTVVPAPTDALAAAMTDAEGPGAHVLYQDFVVPVTLGSAILEFDLFVGNRANAFFTPSPATLAFDTPALNQQARVDILRGGTNPFSVAPADVLMNLFQTQTGNPLVSGYTAFSVDVTALLLANLGQTLRLRFAETDNVFMFQFGVDDVSLETSDVTAIPEPTTLLLVGSALAGLVARRPRGK